MCIDKHVVWVGHSISLCCEVRLVRLASIFDKMKFWKAILAHACMRKRFQKGVLVCSPT